jgi:hypothetical protein
MVTICNYSLRESKAGKVFISLELEGELELIQSSQTGKFYATAKRCSIPSSFDEEAAQRLIGKQFPGKIERVQTEEYDYLVKETGEVIKLCHTYAYVPEEKGVVSSHRQLLEVF